MRAVITQPNFIPNMHRFGMVSACDTFVFLDDVEYSATRGSSATAYVHETA